MSEFQLKNSSLQPERPATSASPLQESFIRLQQAEQLRQRGKLDQAQAICESLVQLHPDYTGALHTLGLVLGDKEKHLQALEYLVRAAMLNPRSWTTLTALSGVYLRLGAIEMAKQTIEQAQLIKPQEGGVLLMLGDVHREDCEYELARDAYRNAVTLDHSLSPAAIGLGWCWADIGGYAEAAEIFEDLIGGGMRLLEPIRALATLPASVVRIDLLAQLDKVLRGPSEDQTEFENSVAFMRSIALDRAGRHAEAWELAASANRRVFIGMQRSFEGLSDRRRTSLASLRALPAKAGRGGSGDSGRPISLFILGPSRSGKTTMERLVSTLAGVKRGYENPIVGNAARRTFQASALPTESVLGHLPPPAYPLCREMYLDELARRAGSASVFTNTHSGCIFEAARIVSIFEDVRFIFMKRNVEDNLLRIFMRKYAAGNAYGYDLKTAREHILWYNQMIDVMAEKFPNVVRVIHYEDMVSNPAASLRTAAELCGLRIPHESPPTLAGDPGCAVPYRKFMAVELES